MITELTQNNIINYAKKFADDGYIIAGTLAVRCDQGMAFAKLGADLKALTKDDILYIDEANSFLTLS